MCVITNCLLIILTVIWCSRSCLVHEMRQRMLTSAFSCIYGGHWSPIFNFLAFILGSDYIKRCNLEIQETFTSTFYIACERWLIWTICLCLNLWGIGSFGTSGIPWVQQSSCCLSLLCKCLIIDTFTILIQVSSNLWVVSFQIALSHPRGRRTSMCLRLKLLRIIRDARFKAISNGILNCSFVFLYGM